jgi:hypothetical protein
MGETGSLVGDIVGFQIIFKLNRVEMFTVWKKKR